MQDFRPPIEHHWFLRFCKLVLPLQNWKARIAVKVAGDGLERLRAMKDKRAVIVSNHSDQFDPEVMFTVSKMLNEDFFFVAARECFDWARGFCGWCFQRVGCYSVVRGKADFEFVRTTIRILANGPRKLVMYPEGEVTREPDIVLPLRKGTAKLFLEGQQQLNKQRPGEPLYIIPIGTRWTYGADVMPRLHSAMRKVERELRIVPPSPDLVSRVEHATNTMMTILETEYLAKPRPELAFEQRVIELREHILRSMAETLNVELPEGETHIYWLRRVTRALDQFVNAEMSSKPAFQKRLHGELAEKIARLRIDASRVQHLVGVTKATDPRQLTPERLAALVAKLEREVLGKVSDLGVSTCVVSVGEPISLQNYLSTFETNREEAVDAVTNEMRSALQQLIDRLDFKLHKDYAASLPR